MAETLQEMAKRIYDERQRAKEKLKAEKKEELRKEISECEKMIMDIFDISNKSLSKENYWFLLVKSIEILWYVGNKSSNIEARLESEPQVYDKMEVPEEIQTLMERLESGVIKEQTEVTLKQISEDFSKISFFEVNYETSDGSLFPISLTIKMKE